MFSYAFQPSLYNYLSHNMLPAAYPPNWARNPAVAASPLDLFFMWEDATYDADFLAAITEAAARVTSLVTKEQGALYENSPSTGMTRSTLPHWPRFIVTTCQLFRR